MKVISFYTIIAACLRTLLDFSTPVAAYGGWNINSDTCSEDDTNVLNKYFGRAAFAHENLAEAFGRLRGSMTEEIQQLVLYVLGGPNPNDATAAIAAAEIMFAGGIDPTRAGSPYIRGLASLNRPISQATAYNYPNGVIVYCEATRLARGVINGQPITFDKESQTTYQEKLPPCGDDWEAGSAIVLTHFAQRNPGQSSYEPDRVTFCPWFIEDVKEMDEEGLLWDTTSSIYYLRRRATLIEDGNGNVDLDAWREWRNNYMPWGIPLPDIDMSIRFDTFLTGVLAHTSAGGLKGTSGGVGGGLGQVFATNDMPPSDSESRN